jgi:hypothetical protein
MKKCKEKLSLKSGVKAKKHRDTEQGKPTSDSKLNEKSATNAKMSLESRIIAVDPATDDNNNAKISKTAFNNILIAKTKHTFNAEDLKVCKGGWDESRKRVVGIKRIVSVIRCLSGSLDSLSYSCCRFYSFDCP